MSGTVRLWLTVYPPEAMLGSGTVRLWWRDMVTDFAPREGDSVMLLTSEEEPEGSVNHRVKYIYWNHDGGFNAELVPFQMDPNEQVQPHLDGRYRAAWWTATDGDLNAKLAASDWIDYSKVRPS